jgi:branched-chain amino acid transport system permease protein
MQFVNSLEILANLPVLNIGLLIDGLLIGSVFALAAYGLALVWGVMNVKNLAQGDFVMMGGYTSWLLAGYGLHPLLGVPVAFVILWVFGWLVYRLVVSKVIHRGPLHVPTCHFRYGDRHSAIAQFAVRT